MKGLRTIDLTYGAVFVVLMAIGANITVWFPMLAVPIGGTSVPLSLQTFFAILAGLMLGRKLGTLSVLVYILVGFAGVPVFAGLSAGPTALLTPTGGFIISFIFVAYFTGWMVDKRKESSLFYYLLAALVGTIINYGIGVSYMYVALNTWLAAPITYPLAWASMIPFLIKDIAFAGLTALFMVRIATRIPVVRQAKIG
ncbi:biotin transporter BioY [Virgibacillus sp. AGTR]|uniref:biotin transporter BioY n=1 Tax=Virgibacillus sp. AGTR TaxID=2812055 RepID=UPI0019657B44|nr:biotin transporter BioY [Virgibacillus sp. AGTR]MCC2249468.1 biotin transporter BioY [Virgibacillus sp. AGTR]QRZ17835.1 biotin transporter BioY [Virgibacillus sp. AGTR]